MFEKANVMTASPIERLRVDDDHVARDGLNSRIPDRRTERRDEPRSLLSPTCHAMSERSSKCLNFLPSPSLPSWDYYTLILSTHTLHMCVNGNAVRYKLSCPL